MEMYKVYVQVNIKVFKPHVHYLKQGFHTG